MFLRQQGLAITCDQLFAGRTSEHRLLTRSPARFSQLGRQVPSQPFDFKEALDKVTIDLNRATSGYNAVAARNKVVIKFRREGHEVEVLGPQRSERHYRDRFGRSRKPARI